MTLEALFTRAADQTPGWRTISLRLPAEEVAVFTIDAGTGGQPQHRGTLTLDRATGQTVSWEPFESLDRARRWRSIARFAHTGEVGGLIGQTIAGLVSAATAVLVWTGLALTFRRFFGKRRGPEGADDADGSSVAD